MTPDFAKGIRDPQPVPGNPAHMIGAIHGEDASKPGPEGEIARAGEYMHGVLMDLLRDLCNGPGFPHDVVAGLICAILGDLLGRAYGDTAAEAVKSGVRYSSDLPMSREGVKRLADLLAENLRQNLQHGYNQALAAGLRDDDA